MLNILKANIIRLFKNKLFIAGCAAAVIITVFFLKNSAEILGMHLRSESESLQLISIGVIMFISVFPTYFMGSEYSGGVIRNKVIMGYKQSDIYAAHNITAIIASLVIEICWIVGGIIGGVDLTKEVIFYAIKLFFSMVAYSSFITILGMRIRKTNVSAPLGIAAFQMGFMTIIFLAMIASNEFGTVLGKIFMYLTNCITIGRWFTSSQLSDSLLMPNLALSILIPLIMTVVYFVIGTYGINRRDLQ